MAYDLQFTYPQQIIKISSVTLMEGTSTPTLRIIGDDFSAVDEVLLNDITSPAVQIISKTELTAELPSTVTDQTLVDVVVVSYRLLYSVRSVIAFRAGRTNRKVSGINRLVQLFVKVLLTTPGSDIFDPQLGGGALRNIGKTFSKEDSGRIVSDFVIAVDNTVKQITAVQSRKTGLPRDERLLSADVISAHFDRELAALVVSVSLVTQAGTTTTTNLVL